ncbi:MAG TPA: ATP-binding protein [Chloroflexi bacterium]|nr:ATP-binding protein [Chloroflexota bacterium]
MGGADAGCVTTSVAELARNLWQHAGGGTITLHLGATPDDPWIEVQAEDTGPGIADVAQAMQDGYSTIGSLGSGLPGVRRLMDEFRIESEPRVGTRIIARKWAKRRK